MRKLVFCFGVLFAFPLTVFAAETPFFEFNPDYYNTEVLDLIYKDTPSEIFIPQNDFISGFDVWLDNNGASGLARFEFVDDASGTVLAVKTLIIPSISRVAGGQRFHVSISQIPVSNEKKYAVRIISSLPSLRLFYASRVKYLAHNATFVSEYIDGAARLGSEEKEFSFKFALYENLETKMPIFKNITTAVLSENEVKISFNADEPIDYRLVYGISGGGMDQQTDFRDDYSVCGVGLNPCGLVVLVEPNQIYDFRLEAKDIWGNLAQIIGTFASMPTGPVTPVISPTEPPENSPTPTTTPQDTTPPMISNVRASQITPNSVNFSWQTDEAANSFYLISFSTQYITIAAGFDSTFEMEHSMNTGPALNPDTIYIVKITSTDLFNNLASFSFVFATAAAGPDYTPPPTSSPQTSPLPSGYTPPSVSPSPASQSDFLPVLSITLGDRDSIILRWSELASRGEPKNNYKVDIFNPKGQRLSSQTVPTGVHQITINPPLSDSGNTAIVYANNDGVVEKVAQAAKIQPAIQPAPSRKPFWERLLALLPYILIASAAIVFGVIMLLKHLKKNKPKIPPSVKSPPSAYSNSQSYGV